jgi:hypothetical protein
MIWKSMRYLLFAEFVTWLSFAVLASVFGMVLGRFGFQAKISLSVVLAVWLALFLLVIRYRRF